MKGLVLLLLLTCAQAHAAGGRSDFLSNLGQGISKKADARYQDRWTLADWFETKRKSTLQDMWLAGHRKDDALEFMVGGRTGARTTTTLVNEVATESANKPQATQAVAAAYATFAGLEGAYVDVESDSWGYDGFVALRPFGDSLQNTNITLLYGLQHREDVSSDVTSVSGIERVKNQTAKARLTLYVNKAIGLEGHYQWVFKESSNLGAEISGSGIEATAFIDFSLLRIFGTWSRETRYREFSGTRTERRRDSLDFGAKLFF